MGTLKFKQKIKTKLKIDEDFNPPYYIFEHDDLTYNIHMDGTRFDSIQYDVDAKTACSVHSTLILTEVVKDLVKEIRGLRTCLNEGITTLEERYRSKP